MPFCIFYNIFDVSVNYALLNYATMYLDAEVVLTLVTMTWVQLVQFGEVLRKYILNNSFMQSCHYVPWTKKVKEMSVRVLGEVLYPVMSLLSVKNF